MRLIFKAGGQENERIHVQKLEELPQFLNAEAGAKALGVSPSSGYELMHEKDFPLCASGTASWPRKKSSDSGWSSTQMEVANEAQQVDEAGPNQKLFSSAQ